MDSMDSWPDVFGMPTNHTLDSSATRPHVTARHCAISTP